MKTIMLKDLKVDKMKSLSKDQMMKVKGGDDGIVIEANSDKDLQ